MLRHRHAITSRDAAAVARRRRSAVSLSAAATTTADPKSSGHPETRGTVSSQQQQSECRKQQGCQQDDGSEAHAPLPDMESDPFIFYTRMASESDVKGYVVKSFKEMVEMADNMQESAALQKDVSGMSVKITRGLGHLSLESLKEVERQIVSEFEGQRKEMVLGAFYDLVSMAGSNPAIRLLKIKIESGDIKENTTKESSGHG